MRHTVASSLPLYAVLFAASMPLAAARAQSPATQPPATQPPATQPPATQPPAAQPHAAAAELPAKSVAVLDVALYTAGANLKEASDTSHAALATTVLRGKLTELLGPALVDSSAVGTRAHAPQIRELAGDQACNVIVKCARAVGRDLGAAWVIMAKVSKTSNLIWLLTGQLINVATGEIVMDDSTELKGDPEAMVRAGVRIFAERVARTVKERAGGQQARGS